MSLCLGNVARYEAVCFWEEEKKRPRQCRDHSSPLMWLMISIFFLGFCCSDLAPDTSLGVTGDIIPIAISSKQATQFIHKFKCTYYQVKQKNVKTHRLPYRHSFLTETTPPIDVSLAASGSWGKKSCQKQLLRESWKLFSNENALERTTMFNRSVRYKMFKSPLNPERFPNSPTSELEGQFILSILNYNYLGMCLISKIYQDVC